MDASKITLHSWQMPHCIKRDKQDDLYILESNATLRRSARVLNFSTVDIWSWIKILCCGVYLWHFKILSCIPGLFLLDISSALLPCSIGDSQEYLQTLSKPLRR